MNYLWARMRSGGEFQSRFMRDQDRAVLQRRMRDTAATLTHTSLMHDACFSLVFENHTRADRDKELANRGQSIRFYINETIDAYVASDDYIATNYMTKVAEEVRRLATNNGGA